MKELKGDKVSEQPPSRVQGLANSYYPISCYPIAPVNVYRVLLWFKASKVGVLGVGGTDCINHV